VYYRGAFVGDKNLNVIKIHGATIKNDKEHFNSTKM
jgi:hypothetical protein